jgi:drug/metabolite transporter (DMT)-like permease
MKRWRNECKYLSVQMVLRRKPFRCQIPWNKALKAGDMRHIGLLSYLTPLASTTLLLIVTGRSLSWHIALAAALIIGAALLGTRKN